MGDIRQAEPVKFFVGMLSAYPGAFAEAESRLSEAIGPVDLRSDLFAHEFTEYYRDEMGQPLVRYFISFADLEASERLAAVKRLTNEIEAEIAEGGEWPIVRPVNLDPGYIAPSKLVLASTKDFAHRIHLGQGIYAEVTLQWRSVFDSRRAGITAQDGWHELPWTYPDYRTRDYQGFFDRVRARLMEQRGEMGRD